MSKSQLVSSHGCTVPLCAWRGLRSGFRAGFWGPSVSGSVCQLESSKLRFATTLIAKTPSFWKIWKKIPCRWWKFMPPRDMIFYAVIHPRWWSGTWYAFIHQWVKARSRWENRPQIASCSTLWPKRVTCRSLSGAFCWGLELRWSWGKFGMALWRLYLYSNVSFFKAGDL